MELEFALTPGMRQMLVQELPRPRMVTVHTVGLRHRARQIGLDTPATDFIRTRETRNHLPRFFRVSVTAYVTGHRAIRTAQVMPGQLFWPPTTTSKSGGCILTLINVSTGSVNVRICT